MIYTLYELTKKTDAGGDWVPARPQKLPGFWKRLHAAFVVLMGDGCVVRWK
jgi:hypothetical protein